MQKTKKNRLPKVTVIVPVYNAEAYIEECLDSLIEQDIGIDNIEVLIVNDATPDNSINIAQKYIDTYPNSMQIIEHKQNQGLGAARNTGWGKAKGKYIAFLDSDDCLDSNVFSLAINKMEIDNAIDIILYAFEYFSESNKQYPRNPSAKLFPLNKTIPQYEIAQYPELIHALSACNKVYRKDFLDKLPKFPTGHFEDMLFSIQGYILARKIHITDESTYFYRKREGEGLSITDDYLSKKSNYFDHLSINEKLHELGIKHKQIEYAINWFNVRSWHGFITKVLKNEIEFSKKEKEELFTRTKELWSNCDPDNLYSDGINKAKIELVKAIQNASSFSELQRLLFPNRRRKNTLNSQNLKSFIKKQVPDKYMPIIQKIKYNIFERFAKKAQTVSTLLLQDMEVKQEIADLKKHKEYLNFPNDIWLFSERGNEAKDNAFVLFKFIREHYPDIPAYYIFTKEDSQVYAQVEKLGNIIDKNSDHHKISFLKSKYLICTHSRGMIAPWSLNSMKSAYPSYFNKKYIFLQHGITHNDVSQALGKDIQNFDLFITGAKLEYDYILKNFGYTENEVKYTGFARYDNLHNIKTNNTILLMPTWRTEICQPSWVNKRIINDSAFIKSEYYRRYQELINSEHLIGHLEKNDLELIFYPHYEVQQYLKYFTTSSSKIKIASKDQYDVQTLLKESKLLITDYSSVFFDFAYMQKPVLFYQFDETEFFGTHYKRGYFNYKTQGFGVVCNNIDRLLFEVDKAVLADFSIKEKYLKRIDKFFPLHDKNNCQRIFDEIFNLENHSIEK